MGGVLVFALRAMADQLLPEKPRPWVPWGAVIIGTAGAFLLIRGRCGLLLPQRFHILPHLPGLVKYFFRLFSKSFFVPEFSDN